MSNSKFKGMGELCSKNDKQMKTDMEMTLKTIFPIEMRKKRSKMMMEELKT